MDLKSNLGSSKIFFQQTWFQKLDTALKNKFLQKNLISVRETLTSLNDNPKLSNTSSFSSSFFSSSSNVKEGPLQRKLILDLIIDFESFLTKAEKDYKNTVANQEIIDLLKVISITKELCSEKKLKESQDWILNLIQMERLVEESLILVELRKMIISSYYEICSSNKQINYEETKVDIQYIQKKLDKAFQHPLLISFSTNFQHELKVFSELCSTQSSLEKFDFLTSILSLFNTKNYLSEWKNFIQKEQSSSNNNRFIYVGWTFGWLNKIYQTDLSKFSLYFYLTLKRHEEGKILTNLLERAESHYFVTIEEFVSKTGVFNLNLILNAKEIPTYDLNGYKLPKIENLEENSPQKSGLLSWTPIFSFPKSDPPKEHWPNIITLFFQYEDYLQNPKNFISFFDSKVQFTYFIIQIEPNLILSLLYKGKKDSPSIREFLIESGQVLRLEKVFSHLK